MKKTFDIAYYRQGYTVGVGGLVISQNKVLLTQIAFGSSQGDWTIPGGFVERNETIDHAIQREVVEETGVQANVKGLIAVRNRIMTEENSIYFIFLLETETAEPIPDGVEVQEARYFTYEEIQVLPKLRSLSKVIITQFFENKVQLLSEDGLPEYPLTEFIIFH